MTLSRLLDTISRQQFQRTASLTEEDPKAIGKCRRCHNRLGFPTTLPSSAVQSLSQAAAIRGHPRTDEIQRRLPNSPD